MKRAVRISIFTVLLFAVVVLLTAKIETPFDGNDFYGYPLTFLTKYSGMIEGPPLSPRFSFLNLVIDLLPVTALAVLLEWAIFAGIKKIKSRSVNSTGE